MLPASAILGASASGRAVVGAALIAGAVLLGVGALMLVRRALLGGAAPKPGGALSLKDLREMRDRGALTEEEFERAKVAVTRSVHQATANRTATAQDRAPNATARDRDDAER